MAVTNQGSNQWTGVFGPFTDTTAFHLCRIVAAGVQVSGGASANPPQLDPGVRLFDGLIRSQASNNSGTADGHDFYLAVDGGIAAPTQGRMCDGNPGADYPIPGTVHMGVWVKPTDSGDYFVITGVW